MGCKRLCIWLVVLVCLSSAPAFASGNFAWVGSFTGEFSAPSSIATDNSNNVYITGFISNIFSAQIDADPGAGTATLNGPAGFIVKLNSNRVFQWGITLPMTVNAVDVAPSGNLVLVGNFQGTVDLDPGAGTANFTATDGTDGVVVELTSNGAFVQAFQIAGTAEQRIEEVAVDGSGNIHIAGSYKDTTDFDPSGGTSNLSPNVAGNRDIFVAKYTSAGALTWASAFHGNDSDFALNTKATGIVVDSTGGVVTSGSFHHTIDIDPGASVNNLSSGGSNDIDTDAFFSKLDSNGEFVYGFRLGGVDRDNSGGVGLDSATDDTVFSGNFRGVVDIQPGTGTNNQGAIGVTSAFVVRLDETGGAVWSISYAANQTDEGHFVAVDGEGSIHLTGGFNNVVDFDPGPGVFNLTETGSGSMFPNNDIYVLKLDNDGDFIFAKGYGNMLPHSPTTITTDSTDASIYGGYFQGTLVFNPTNGTIVGTQFMMQSTFNTYFHKLAGPLATAWVDFGSGLATETGAEATPYKTLDAAVKGVRVNGTINIKGNTGDPSSSETLVIDKDVTINAISGTVTIGAP